MKTGNQFAVIWSWFFDDYIIKPLPQVGAAMDLQCIGTHAECAAWIAQQR